MKTALIFILLFFSFFLFAQSKMEGPSLAILDEGERLIALDHADSALLYARAILIRPKIDLLSRNQAYLVLGKALFNEGDPDGSVFPLQKSLSIARSIQNDRLILKALVALSAAMTMKEYPRMDSVLIYLEEAKPMAESLKDTSSLSGIYNNLANIYIDDEDYDRAMAHCYLCESLLKNSKFEIEKAKCHNSTGRGLFELYYRDGKEDDLKTAITSFQKAVEIFERLGRKRYEAYARMNIGAASAFLDDYKRAEKETRMGINLGEELSDSTILLNGYYNLANHYEGENKLEEAKLALRHMNALLEKAGDAGDLAFVTDQFSNNQVRVSAALVNNRIDLLDKQIEIAKSVQEKQFLWFISIVLGLFVIGISIFVYQKNKLSTQEKKMLQEQLENTLKSQEIEFMRARFEGEEVGRHKIARLIHDGVGGLLVSAKWNLEAALEELSKKETQVAARLNENLRLQEHSYKELRRVVFALEQEDTPWWDDLEKFYQQITAHSTAKVRFHTYNLDKKVRGNIGKESRLIVQEIITNALKHSKASEISVQINQIDGVLGIIIEDNGIGFDPDNITKGVELVSIEERCLKLGGSVSFESGKNGTTVFIDIPVDDKNNLKENPLLYAGAN
ncbi:MAG: ATP-binding protein [Saprospiraceae bacterium]